MNRILMKKLGKSFLYPSLLFVRIITDLTWDNSQTDENNAHVYHLYDTHDYPIWITDNIFWK